MLVPILLVVIVCIILVLVIRFGLWDGLGLFDWLGYTDTYLPDQFGLKHIIEWGLVAQIGMSITAIILLVWMFATHLLTVDVFRSFLILILSANAIGFSLATVGYQHHTKYLISMRELAE